MGYYMQQTDTKFEISKKKFSACMQAIQKLAACTWSDGSPRRLEWVDMNFTKKETLAEMLLCWRWEIHIDQDGNVSDIFFTGNKYGDEELLLAALGPFVKRGSYITFLGEDGEQWRYCFDGKGMKTRQGRVTFR